MIGYLKGKVIAKKGQEVWVEVNGVGYRVRVGESQISRYKIQDTNELYIHTNVKQDGIELFGFESMEKLMMFEMLLNVSGVGPKTALAIVGAQSVEQIYRAVQEADVAFFKAMPGLGTKGSQRIIVDLKGKIPSLKELDLTEGDESDDVVVALVQFGFKREHVLTVLKELEPGLSDEQKIREGLKRLGKR
jgi:holliday junction DNA helicase RuvA